jgi:hypothetical protein
MKAFLLYKSRDFDLKRASPPNEQALVQDLELDTLFDAMSRGDKFILEVVRKVILTGPYEDLETIKYRQAALKDCLDNAATLRRIYALCLEALEKERKAYYGLWKDYPGSLLQRSVTVVGLFVELLRQLRVIADKNIGEFGSEAFLTLFTMLGRELGDDYFAVIGAHLKRLGFRDGVLLSAELGTGLKGKKFVLRKPNYEPRNWLARLWGELTELCDWVLEKFGKPPSGYHLYLAPRDEQGARAMTELRDRGVGLAADALAQCADHMLSFFNMLRVELAFYIGCVNLREQLDELKEHISFPTPVAAGEMSFSCTDLYDVCLALSKKGKVVGNDVTADNKKLIIITGANTGGKSTFLRSVGLAQLMLQCGMFVPAAYLRANLVDGVFTHYKREEDTTMKSGKFDEELARMNEIANQLTPQAMILFNESFAATNEREGSEVARQIVSALLEKELKLVFVTHLYEFAHGVFELQADTAIFLRADRREDGRRTFKLVEGKPLPTSFGEDLYRQIFRDDPEPRSTDKTLLESNSSAA